MTKMKAAVLYELNRPLQIEEVNLDDPQENEVLVKLKASGICHSDLHAIEGNIPCVTPLVLGHEGAGIVEKVGPGVTSLQPGDHVVLFLAVSCGECQYCREGNDTLCAEWTMNNMMGTLPGGGKRLHKGDQELNHFFAMSCYAEYVVVNEIHAVKVREDAPLEKICLLSCGASTGLGAVLRRARVQAGESVAVYGCGGVGLSAIMGARLAGAWPIIAVDMVDLKLEKAKEIGADYMINASNENPPDKIRELTGGGADYAMDCSGHVSAMTQAFASIHQAGTGVIVAQANMADTLAVVPGDFILGKTMMGVCMGNIKAHIDIPTFVDLYMEGRLPIDKLISKTYKLEELNEAFEAMKKGEIHRSIIVYE